MLKFIKNDIKVICLTYTFGRTTELAIKYLKRKNIIY
jgi:hypothetical protein